MSKILITGSAGFIFSNMINWLLQYTDHTVVSIDKLTYAGSLLNISHNSEFPIKRHKFYLGDVCDADFVAKVFAIEKPDYVISAAAESHVDNSISDPGVFVRTNVMGTHSILEAALKVHTPQKLINISTDEVYGSVEEGFSVEEDTLTPRSPYSATKASADLLGQAYFTTYGLPVITTRCSNNYGPRQHVEKFIPKTITNILRGRNIPVYGDGSQSRNWIYVGDHYGALKTILDCGVPGEVYNIGTEDSRTNLEVLNTIFDIMGDGSELVEHVQDRLGHDRRYAVNYDKLKALGWAPKYKFEDALAHTIKWYKLNLSWFEKGIK